MCVCVNIHKNSNGVMEMKINMIISILFGQTITIPIRSVFSPYAPKVSLIASIIIGVVMALSLFGFLQTIKRERVK